MTWTLFEVREIKTDYLINHFPFLSHTHTHSHYDTLIKKKTDNSLSDAFSDLNSLDLKVNSRVFFHTLNFHSILSLYKKNNLVGTEFSFLPVLKRRVKL